MFELISRKLVHLLWKLIVTFFILQYGLNQQKEAINDLIQKAIYEANKELKLLALDSWTRYAISFIVQSIEVENLKETLCSSNDNYDHM
jgi:hypothetical protein